MGSAALSLWGSFILSVLGLFAFIWSLRPGLLVVNPRRACAMPNGHKGHFFI